MKASMKRAPNMRNHRFEGDGHRYLIGEEWQQSVLEEIAI